MSIKIVTDSTSDITQERAKKLGITVVPLHVNFGDEEFVDGVTISNKEFFDRLRKVTDNSQLPKTSQVTVGAFMEAFTPLVNNPQDQVLGIFLSSELSGTFQSANLAKDSLGSKNITLVDSRQVSFGLGLIVEIAVQMRDAGKTVKEIADRLNELKQKIRVYAGIQDLKYLKLGGRLSGAKALLGGILGVKPIVAIEDGKVVPAASPRGTQNAYKWLVEQYLKCDIDETLPRCLGHTDSPDTLKQFSEFVLKQVPNFPVNHYYDIGITVGTHAGPGCVGMAYFVK